jgi:CNT family concentrative nucleoside transporter
MQNIQSAVGIFALLALAFVVSEDRRLVSWRQAATGLAVTFVLAVLMLKIPQLRAAFAVIGDAVDAIAAATRAGTTFVFGYLGGGPLPYELKTPGAEFVFALQALPVVLVMSVLTTLMFHWGILPPIVRGFASRSNGRSASAAPSGSRPPPTSSSAWSRRRCASSPISAGSPAANCSW